MSVQLFKTLPTRPPTPPRESNYDPMADAPAKQSLVRPAFNPLSSFQTPPNGAHSPKSTAADSKASSRRSGKNVAFAPNTEVNEPPIYDTENRVSPPSGPLLPSSQASKPPKGILKPSLSPNPLQFSFNNANGVTCHRSLIEMLDSSVRQLAGDDLVDKTDAYQTLSNALRASNNLPDRFALQDRMPRFMEFIQRDITTTPLNSSLANHALNFLMTVQHFPGIAGSLTNEFGVFIIDHATRSFGDSSVPKDVIRHLLHVVAKQSFSPRVMAPDRVGRLLAALNNIEKYVNGKSIVHSRIMVYRRLLKQCKPLMVAHSNWLRDLLTDCLSTTKDIRAAAIALGFEAASHIGKDRQISRRLSEIFSATADGQKYIDFYIERLTLMLKSRQDGVAVTKIWTIVLLLMRGTQLDKWQHLNPWLRLIQTCFNNNSVQTKQEANYAWNRFVYVVHFEESTFSRLLGSTLCKPMCSQWRLKSSVAKSDGTLQSTVFGSTCSLFYYVFKPGTSHALLDKHWDRALKPVMQQLCVPEQPEAQIDYAISIFTNLFDSTTRRQWIEDRVMTKPLAEASELPALDPKWLRRNAARVFQALQPILDRRFTELADPPSPTSVMWQTLITSVSSAASKEIMVSSDTTEFVSHVFTCLLNLWRRGLPQQAEKGEDTATLSPGFLASAQRFIRTVIDAFGVIPFTEKQICIREEKFAPATTPSHRTGKPQGIAKTPLQHLFSVLSSPPEGVADDDAFSSFLQGVFGPFFKAKDPRAAFELAQEMLNTIPMDQVCAYGLWVMLADAVKPALALGRTPGALSPDGSGREDKPVGKEYRDICRILERGLKLTPNLPWEQWASFLDAFEAYVSDDTGDSGRALAVVEPLSKTALDHLTALPSGVSARVVRITTALLSHAIHPRDRQAVDAAKIRLWGGAKTAKAQSFDPFDNLYKLANSVMENVYHDLSNEEVTELAGPLLAEVDGFLGRCNPVLALRTLTILQDGLVFWIKDDESRLSSRQAAKTAAAAKQVWDQVCHIISAQESPQSISLDSLERLFCAAFQSKHRHVVNSMTVLWNRVFDNIDTVEYPETLKATLLGIRPIVDIILPGLEESSEESGAAQRHSFIETQDDMDALNLSSVKSPLSDRVRIVPSSSSVGPTPMPTPTPAALGSNDSRMSTPLPSRKGKKQSRTKLRHEDSQIQFAPVEAVPSNKEVESQVLTERQVEVRGRQRGQGELYNIQSSSPGRQGVTAQDEEVVNLPRPQALPVVPEQTTPTKATPALQSTYEDYISSTPTPRRGQMLPLDHDVEMSEPPSSPPDVSAVRRYPLIPEIRSRSASVNEVVDWDEFSSSPVSGSPVPQRVAAGRQERAAGSPRPEGRSEREGELADDVEEEDSEDARVADSFALDVVPSSVPFEESISSSQQSENKIQGEGEGEVTERTPTRREIRKSARIRSEPPWEQQGQQEPSTPARARSVGAAPACTPRSENEEFVDALTSPEATTAAAKDLNPELPAPQPLQVSASFSSETLDQSMIRLVEEMEGRQAQAQASAVLGSESSQMLPPSRPAQANTDVADCIVVSPDKDNSASNNHARAPVRRPISRRNSQRVIPSTPESRVPSVPTSKKSTTGGGRKRKRDTGGASQSREATTTGPSTRSNKRRRSKADPEAIASVENSPSLRRSSRGSSKHRRYVEEEEEELAEDEAVASQLMSEHNASQQRRGQNVSRPSPELGEAPASDAEMRFPDDDTAMADIAATPANTQGGGDGKARAEDNAKGPAYKAHKYFSKALAHIQGAAISREEFNRLEDEFMAFKRELYLAEERGRAQQRAGSASGSGNGGA